LTLLPQHQKIAAARVGTTCLLQILILQDPIRFQKSSAAAKKTSLVDVFARHIRRHSEIRLSIRVLMQACWQFGLPRRGDGTGRQLLRDWKALALRHIEILINSIQNTMFCRRRPTIRPCSVTTEMCCIDSITIHGEFTSRTHRVHTLGKRKRRILYDRIHRRRNWNCENNHPHRCWRHD
jgi:hypothetical protein